MEEKVKKEGLEQPTYEQLKFWLEKAVNDNKQLLAKLNEVTNVTAIMPWLFKVVECKESFDSAFVQSCIASIKEILTPIEESKETKTEEKK